MVMDVVLVRHWSLGGSFPRSKSITPNTTNKTVQNEAMLDDSQNLLVTGGQFNVNTVSTAEKSA